MEDRPSLKLFENEDEYVLTDSRAEIDKCLACKWPDCVNCIGTGAHRQRPFGRHGHYNADIIRDSIEKGQSIFTLAARLEVAVNTAQNYKVRFHREEREAE